MVSPHAHADLPAVAAPFRSEGRRFLNIWMAGLAFVRCHEHGEVDNAARDTLCAMASFVGRDNRHKLDPVCLAAQGAIAERAKLSVRAMADAQKRLADLGLIERVGKNGKQLSYTVRWRLSSLASTAAPAEERAPSSSAGAAVERPADDRGSAGAAEERPAGAAEERPAGAADNISSDLSRPLGREKRGRSDAADAAPLPGGRDSATAPSTVDEPGPSVYGEIAVVLGCTTSAAEAWARRKVDGASSLVRNEPAFLRTCLQREIEQRAEPRRPAKGTTATAKGTTAKRGAAAARLAKAPTVRFSKPERERGARRVLSGELTASELAVELGNSPVTVAVWVRGLKSHALSGVKYRDMAVAEAAELMGCSITTAEQWFADLFSTPLPIRGAA